MYISAMKLKNGELLVVCCGLQKWKENVVYFGSTTPKAIESIVFKSVCICVLKSLNGTQTDFYF